MAETSKKPNRLVRYFFITEYFPGDSEGPKNWSLDHFMTWFSAGVLLIGVAYSVYALLTFSDDRPAVVTCTFRNFTGLYCPGCGATHALYELLHGHILRSITLNTLIPVLIFSLVPYTILNFLHLRTKGKVIGLRFHTWYLGIFAVIILAHFAVVNYYLVVHGVHLIP